MGRPTSDATWLIYDRSREVILPAPEGFWPLRLSHREGLDVNDRQLVQRMRSGDERAFDEFFAAYFPRLFHFAVRRLGNEDAAEDVVQAALIIATRKIGVRR